MKLVKKLLLLSFLGLFLIITSPMVSFADTIISGRTISTDTTWTLENSPYIITGDITVRGSGGANGIATLTIEPGVELRFNTGVDLFIGGGASSYHGALIAQGTADNKIKFTSSNVSDPSPGDWGGIEFRRYSNNNITILEHCEIEYGGGNTRGNLYFYWTSGRINNCEISNSSTHGLYLGTYSSPTITNCNIGENAQNGIYGESSASATITGNNISGNQAYPITAHANSIGKIKDNTGSENTSDGIQVLGGTISNSATWFDQGLFYLIAGDITVRGSGGASGIATLTIEPGVELRFNTGVDLFIGGGASSYHGALIAQGTTENKIKFTSSKVIPAPGDWNGITFNNYNNNSLTILEHCEIEYGGSNTRGNLYFYWTSGRINHCKISNSSNHGIYLDGSSTPTITDNEISDNTEYPIRAYPFQIEKIKNNTGSGNKLDGIQVLGGTISNSATWFDQGLFYLIAGDITVHGSGGVSGIATLTIEPGVELRFNTEVDLFIGGGASSYHGALIAQGTTENKIKFTSSKTTPSPGDWNGITFNNYNRDSVTIIEHCIIEYGGNSTNSNLYLSSASPTIQYNTIQHSSNYGVRVYGTGSNNAKINCNNIQDNATGIYLQSSANPEISRNNFKRNTSYGVNNTSSVSVDISSNWWNDANGPGFNGDDVSGNVDYDPQLTVESDCINNAPTNKPPFAPSNPTPAHEAVRVLTTEQTQALTVSWTSADPNAWDTLTYDVYLGTETENLVLVGENLTQSQAEFTALLYGTTYFWQVVAKDTGGLSTNGPVWQFTTEGLPPDMVVSELVWAPDSDLQAGQDITFTATVKNSGEGPCVDAFQVALRLDGAVVRTWDVNQLIEPEDTLVLEGIWNATVGDHTVQIEVDTGKTVVESTEDNNILSAEIDGIEDPAPPTLVSTGPLSNSFSQQVNQIMVTLVDEHGQIDVAAVIASFVVQDQSNQVVAGSVIESNDVFTFTPTVSPFAAGVYTVTFVAADVWGNTQAYNFSFTVDVQAPATPAITGGEVTSGTITVRPGVNQSRLSNIELTGTREDDTRVLINGSPRADFGTGNWTIALVLVQGNNAVEVVIEDRAGNRSESVFVDILFDGVAPVISGVTPADETFLNTIPLTIAVDYSEPHSELDRPASILSVKDKALTVVPGVWVNSGGNQLVFTPTVPFIESVYQVEVRLQDTLGNQGAARMTHFTVDLTAPDSPVIAPVTTPTHTSSQMISGTKEPYAAIWMDGAKVVENTDQGEWSYTVPLVSGQNQFSFTAIDRAGNQSIPALAQIFFDDIPPLAVTNLSVNPDGDGMSVVLTWNGYDENLHGDIASYRIFAQDAVFSSVTSLTPYTTVNAGVFEAPVDNLTRKTPYWFAVVALDTAGNLLDAVTPVTSTPNDIVPPENVSNILADSFENRLVLNWQHSANSGADLAGYKVYFNGATEGVPVALTESQYERTGLAPGTAYDFIVTSIDADENESQGVAFQGITLLSNPANLASTPYSGYVSLSWEGALPAQYVQQYNIYVSETAFTSVEGMTPKRSATGLSANISGLTNDTVYYFAVTTVNLCDGEQKLVTPVASTPTDDTQGPQLSSILFENAPLIDGQNLTTSGRVQVALSDPAGVSAVEFTFNGVMIRKDYSEPYTAYIDIFIVPDGSYPLIVTAYDTLGNSASYEYTLVAGLDAPAPPVITAPVNNAVTNKTNAQIKGTSDKYTDVRLFLDGADTGAVVSVGPLGSFTVPLVLKEGENRLKAVAQNRTGTSPESEEILVMVDTSLPDSPRSLSGQSRPGGEIKLLWQRPLNKIVDGFNIYRLDTSFETKGQAVQVNTDLVTTPGYTDLPSNEGVWFYRVTAVDAAGNESALSNEALVESDGTPPYAVRIEYASQGLVDPVLKRYAPGRVDVMLEVSEPLGTLPFLTITPGGGIPQSVEFEKVSDTVYSGVFEILSSMPDGMAYAVFSARDLAGNRGTAVEPGQGDQLLLDTKGPSISRLDIVPFSPIKNSDQDPVEIQLAFGLTENMKPDQLPQIRLDIANGRQIVDVIGLTQATPQTGESQAWQGTIVLPSDAGLLGSETIEILYSGIDDLDNISTKILVGSSLQVYQGGLPPLAPPGSLTGRAIAQGQIMLAWEAVEQAAGYQIFRQGPGESELTLLDAIGPLTTYTDSTEIDGAYIYAVATIRQENQEESVSGLSNIVPVTSDSVVPNAPSNLVLDVTPQGVRAQWQAPAYTEAITYSIYRSDQAQIVSLAGLTPLVTGINQTMIIDPTPSPDLRCYAIVAVDETGNESLSVYSCYSNFDLLPVSTLEVSQKDYDPPQVIWSHADNTGNIAGFYAFIGKDKYGFKVNEALMTATSFTDYGYAGEDRSYAVIAVDVDNVESMTRFITLPRVSAILVKDSSVKRGIMNKLEYTLKNETDQAVNNIIIKVDLGGHSHQSESVSLTVGESKIVPVVVGGYSQLADIEELTTTIQIAPNPGEKVKIIRTQDIEVYDSMMVLQIKNEAFLRGGIGKVWFTLENSGAAEAQIVTAENSSKNPSSEMVYSLVDEDGNVLYSKAVKQSLGDLIRTLSNKRTVATLPKGATFTSEPMDLFIPANAPDDVYVRLEIDHIYYHLGRADEVKMDGTQTRRQVSLKDTSYYGNVISVLPAVSNGDQDIVILGSAIDRSTEEAIADVPLNLIITVNGFERKINVTTDEAGNFTHTFEPLENEAGVFYVQVVHPDLLDRPEQETFIINKVNISPAKIELSIPKNYEQKISIRVKTEKGTTLTNLRLELETALEDGVHLDIDAPIPEVGPDKTIVMNLNLWADNTAAEFGNIELSVKSDESANEAWGSILIKTQFSQSRPVLYFTPDHVETGVARDDMVSENITLTNKGLADMGDVFLELKDENDMPAPNWVRLNTPPNISTLKVGESKKVSVSFLPGTQIPEGMQTFYLVVNSTNYPRTDIGLYPTVTLSGVGNVLFKISDIYTGTFNAKNELVRGLANAKVSLQKDYSSDPAIVTTTDSLGEVLFEDLVAGSYKCIISATNHQQYTGRIWVKPGITVNKPVFLEYNLVTVEWEVNEITIEDRYEVLLTATYETDVPAAVVVAQPLSITLPDMEKGDVYHGEFVLINHGLVRAEDLTIPIPKSDENFQYEILAGLPQTLEAKQRVTIPYRITCLKSLNQEESTQSGGGCYSYSNCVSVSYGYPCANGGRSTGSTQHCFYKSGGICGSSGSSGGGSTGGGSQGSSVISSTGGSGGSTSSPAPSSTPLVVDEKKCLPLLDRLERAWESGKDKFKHGVQIAGCSVNTALREYNDDATDLVVKVPGGGISVFRKYNQGSWQWDSFSRISDGHPDDKRTIVQLMNCPDYVAKDGVPYAKISAGVYQQGTYTIERKGACIEYGGGGLIAVPIKNLGEYSTEKYIHKDKFGNWRNYDSNGRLMTYGNRLGTIASLVYDSQEDPNPTGIVDKNGDQVIWFEYDYDDNLARVYDADAHEVLYDYIGSNLTKVTETNEDETTYEYDSNNNLTRTVDAAGRATIVTYNKTHDPTSVVDSEGNGHFFEYDYDKNKKEYYARIRTSSGRIKEVWYNEKGENKRVDINGRTVEKIDMDGRNYTLIDEKKNQIKKEFDERENLTKILYPDGTQVSFEYDLRFNKVRRIEDQLGRVTTFEYDDTGNLITKTDAKETLSERVTSFTYDALGRIETATTQADTNTDETVTSFTYDAKSNIETITDPMNQITRFLEYNSMGNLLRMEDARGNEWKFGYDAKGRLISQTTPKENKTSWEYDGANNRTAMVNALLKRFEFEYDDHNNMIKAIDPYAKFIETQYNTDHLPTLVTDQEGKQSSAQYDNEGRVVKSIDGAGNEIIYTYDETLASPVPSNIPVSIKYPTFTRNFTYDKMGRLIKDTSVLDAQDSQVQEQNYDTAGNLISSKDNQGNTTTYEYDDLNRLVLTIPPDLGEIRRTYDNRNNLIMLEDPNHGIQYFTYDKNNRMTSAAKPMTEQTQYEYDAVGNKVAVVDAQNQRIEYTYDMDNKLEQVRYYAPADLSTPVKTVNFTYDKLGNILTYNDGETSGIYTYDDLSRKLTETVNYGPFVLSHAYTYYANGAKKSFTGPDGNTITYAYDEGNRLAGINIPTQGQISYAYDAARWNNPASMLLPGGSKQEYTYDPLMRIKTIAAFDPGKNPLMTRDYTYSPRGNITTKATEHGNYTYDYNTLNRLTTALNPTVADEAYTYDSLGNRKTDVKVPGELIYNANNELETRGDTSYGYDANGNMTQKTKGTDVTLFFYNIEDRLDHLENAAGETIAAYGYDPFGRRLWKEVSGTRTYFAYANEGLIGEYTATGTEIKTYGYKPGSTWTTDPLYMKIGSEYYWYQNDLAGTPQKLIATNGLVVWDGKYDAFGNCQVEIEGITNNLRFAGQYYDEETRLHYNLNRYYDPQIGRYLRADPFGDGLNLYAYCFNNPNSLIDPLGLCAYNKASGWVHGILAGLGMIPAIGIIPDFIDAVLCSIEGDFQGASLSGLAMIPGAGQASRIAQYGLKSKKVIVIGEGMDAIKKAVKELRKEGINAKWYQAWSKNFPKNRRMIPKELDAALKRNKRWIKSKMKEGYNIYDIGPDGRNSPFYSLEKELTKNYPTIPLKRP